MIVANSFILWLLAAAAFVGVAAVVHKRTSERTAESERSSNAAS